MSASFASPLSSYPVGAVLLFHIQTLLIFLKAILCNLIQTTTVFVIGLLLPVNPIKDILFSSLNASPLDISPSIETISFIRTAVQAQKTFYSDEEFYVIMLLALSTAGYGQKFKDYLPPLVCTFLGGCGSSDGLRDASMYRMDGYSKFWNGKNSWNNKFKNGDIRQGPAYFSSTTFLAFTTDGPHLSNMITHQFNGMAMAFMHYDSNKKLGHVFLKVLAYDAVRQAGHSVVYGLIFKSKYPGDNPLPYH